MYPSSLRGGGKTIKQGMLLSDALNEFTEKYLFMRGYSKPTVGNYRWAVNSLIDVIGDIPIENLTIEHILQWKHHAHQNEWDVNSISAYMYKFRLFIRYWSKHANISLDTEDIMIPKRQSKLPKHLSLEQAQDVYRSCRDDRERAMVSLLFSTGIRVGEACRVRVKDIQTDRILIRGKAGKERYVFLDAPAYNDIFKHIASKPPSPYLFSGYSDTMNKSTIQKCMRELGVRAGIPNLTPHVFRHTYATLLLGNGCNLRHIQEMLGHADISTTQIYTHVSNDDLGGAYKKYHVALA